MDARTRWAEFVIIVAVVIAIVIAALAVAIVIATVAGSAHAGSPLAAG
jgi:MFS superfamily sulfate permease-like transporter